LSAHRLREDAEKAWDDAAITLLRLLPTSRRTIRTLIGKCPNPRHLRTRGLEAGVLEGPSDEIEGRSVGLSFLLAQASIVFEVAGTELPADVAASAIVESDGTLSKVEGLAGKLRAIAWAAPSVRRVLVAAAQADEGRAAVREWGLRPFEIVGVRDVADALAEVFGDLPERLAAAAMAGEHRQEFIGDLLRVSMRGPDGDGPPLEAARQVARAALGGSDLAPDERARLEFVVRTITAQEVPWLERLPTPFRATLGQYFHGDDKPEIDWNRRLHQAAAASNTLVRLLSVLALAELQAAGRLRAPAAGLRQALIELFLTSARDEATGGSRVWIDVLRASTMSLAPVPDRVVPAIDTLATKVLDLEPTMAASTRPRTVSAEDAHRAVRQFESLCVTDESRVLAHLDLIETRPGALTFKHRPTGQTLDVFPWMIVDADTSSFQGAAVTAQPSTSIFNRLERGGGEAVAHYLVAPALVDSRTHTGEAAATLERFLSNWEIREKTSRYQFDDIVQHHRQLFVGRQKPIDEAISWIAQHSGGAGLIVGPSGSGKTAFAANLIAEIDSKYAPSDDAPGWLCLRHFAKLRFSTIDLISGISLQLQAEGGRPIDFSQDWLEAREQFFNGLHSFSVECLIGAGLFDRLVVIVDGLDHALEADNYFADLVRGIAERPPANVVWICLGRPTQKIAEQLAGIPFVLASPGLPPLARNAIDTYLRDVLTPEEIERFGTSWTDILDALTSSGRHLPKYLEAFVRDLKNGRFDPAHPEWFRNLPKDIDDQLHRLCERLADRRPALDALVLVALSQKPLTRQMLVTLCAEDGENGSAEARRALDTALALLARETVWTRIEPPDASVADDRVEPDHDAVTFFFVEGGKRSDFRWRSSVRLALLRLVRFCGRWNDGQRTQYERNYALSTAVHYVEELGLYQGPELSPFFGAEFADAVANERPRLEALDSLKRWVLFVATDFTEKGWPTIITFARTHASLAARMDETDWSALIADGDVTRLTTAVRTTAPDRNRRSILMAAIAALLRESGSAAASRRLLDGARASLGKQQQLHRTVDDVTELYYHALLSAESKPLARAISQGALPDPLSFAAASDPLYETTEYANYYSHASRVSKLSRAVAAAAASAHEAQAGVGMTAWRIRSSISWSLMAGARRPIHLAIGAAVAAQALASVLIESSGLLTLAGTSMVAVMLGYGARLVNRSEWFRGHILEETRSMAWLGLRQAADASLRTYSHLCARLGRMRLRSDERAACTPLVLALATRQLRSTISPDLMAGVVLGAIRVTDDLADGCLIEELRKLTLAHVASMLDRLRTEPNVERRVVRIALGVADLLEENRMFLPSLLRNRRSMSAEEKSQIGAFLARMPVSYLAWALIRDLRPASIERRGRMFKAGVMAAQMAITIGLYLFLAAMLEDAWRPLWFAGIVATLFFGVRRWDRHDLTTVRLNGDLHAAASRLIDHLRQKESKRDINVSRPPRDARPVIDTLTAQRLLGTRLDDAEIEPIVFGRVLRRLDEDSHIHMQPSSILKRVMGHPELVEAVSKLRLHKRSVGDTPTAAEHWQQLRRALPVANPLISLLLVAGAAVGLVLVAAVVQWLAFPGDRGDNLLMATVAAWLQIVIAVSVVQHGLPAVNLLLSGVGKRFPSWLYSLMAGLFTLALVFNPLFGLPGTMLGEPVVLPRTTEVAMLGFVPLVVVHVVVPDIIASARGSNLLYPTTTRRRAAQRLAVAVAGVTALALGLLGHLVISLAR
jgi:hypothetical protein